MFLLIVFCVFLMISYQIYFAKISLILHQICLLLYVFVDCFLCFFNDFLPDIFCKNFTYMYFTPNMFAFVMTYM